MPRRAAAGVRPIDPDPVYQSRLVQQVIHKVMIDGKKSLAEQIVYDALEVLSRRTNKEPVESLEASIKALTPNLEVRSRRVGGATYQVPGEVPGRRASPGPGRGPGPPRPHARRALARPVRPRPSREDDGRAPGRRALRRPER